MSTRQPIDLIIRAGLPYRRRARVTGAANIWPTSSDFEVRCQVRVSPDARSTLKATLTPFLTGTIDGEDVLVDLEMTGQQTRNLPGGYYDIVLSDLGVGDARAMTILFGQLKIQPLVTSASDE